jgi:DASH complex subunit Dam1
VWFKNSHPKTKYPRPCNSPVDQNRIFATSVNFQLVFHRQQTVSVCYKSRLCHTVFDMEPRTPLRRISRGSLSALSRSASHAHSHPSDLGVPNVAFEQLADELEHLVVNVEGLKDLDQSLGDFIEGFSSFLWSMKMNAFLTEWHQVRLTAILRIPAK